MKLLSFLCSSSLLISAVAFGGYDFSRVDASFKERLQGQDDLEKFSKTTAIRQEYVRILEKESLTRDEKIYAAGQVGRLDLLRGGFLGPQVPKEKRRQALESCLEVMDSIADTGSEIYHYFNVACIALRGKLSDGFLDRARYGLKMKSAESSALKATSVDGQYFAGYEAGGILRIIGAVRGNRLAKVLGLYNPEEGLQMTRVALGAKKSSYPPFENEYSGKEFFENHYYYAQALANFAIEKNNKSKAEESFKFLNTTTEFLKNKGASLPEERKIEREHYNRLMSDLAAQISFCLAKDDWSSCLASEFEKEAL